MNVIDNPTLYDVYTKHVHPLAVALAFAQEKGVMIDIETRDELSKKVKDDIKQTKKRINELASEVYKKDVQLNPNSSKQVQDLLYKQMRFPVVYNTDQRPTANEDAILKLARKYPSEEVLDLILKYRKDTKLISTFLEVNVDENNCMHTSYNASGTKSFRISSSQDLWKSGMNLQNIPTGKRPGVTNIRHLFMARPSKVFVKADLVQAETMVVARILCRYGDYTLWDKYANDADFDVHRWAAAGIYNIDEKSVQSIQRSVGKVANHSSNYCAGPRAIQSTALKWGVENIDYDMAKHIIATRRKELPGLVKWWRDTERKIRMTRTLTTCLGRRRTFFGRTNDNSVIRDAVSFEPQSTVGDICNTMFRRLYNTLPEGACVLLQVHDEVVVECYESQVDEVVKLIKQSGVVPLWLNKNMDPLIIPLEISIGKNWRDMCVLS